MTIEAKNMQKPGENRSFSVPIEIAFKNIESTWPLWQQQNPRGHEYQTKKFIEIVRDPFWVDTGWSTHYNYVLSVDVNDWQI